MSKFPVPLTLMVLGFAQASDLPLLLQKVEQQPAVQSMQLQWQQNELSKSAPGVLPAVALTGSAGYGRSPEQPDTDWTAQVGGQISYGLLTGPQQQKLLDLESKRLAAELVEVRIVTFRQLLQAEQAFRRASLRVEQGAIEVRLQQLELQAREARWKLGAATALQVQNAQLVLERSQLGLEQEKLSLAAATIDLQRYQLTLPDQAPALPLPPLELNRLSADQLNTQKEQLELEFQGQKLGFDALPQLSLQGSYSNGSSSFSGSLNQRLEVGLDYGYTLNSKINLESWAVRLNARFDLDVTKKAQQSLNTQAQQLGAGKFQLQVQNLQQTRADLLSQRQQAEKLLDLNGQVLKLAKQNLQLEKQRLEQGLGTEVTVLQAQMAVLKEQQNLLDTQKNLQDLTLQLWEAYTWYPQNGK